MSNEEREVILQLCDELSDTDLHFIFGKFFVEKTLQKFKVLMAREIGVREAREYLQYFAEQQHFAE